MPRPRHSPYQGDHVNTSALSKTAAALTLAALAALGTTACTAGGSGDASPAKASASPSRSAAPHATSTPKAGLATKAQCLALEGKLAGSASGLQSAMSALGSGGDPSSALPQLQNFQKDLHAEVGTVTDLALKGPATKFDGDFGAMVATVKAASDAFAAKDASAAQAQSAKLQTDEAALEADATALQRVCG